jgi:gas vesicle protein
MGFLAGVVTGIAAAAAAAAWYMSRSGERFREEYQVESRLGEIGDQVQARTREVQEQVTAQIAEMRAGEDGATAATNGAGDHLDAAQATAAEAAADVEAATTKVKKAAKDVTEG